jgi:DNA processing protein
LKDALALALSYLFHDSPSRARQYYTLFGSEAELTAHREILISQIKGAYNAVVRRRWSTLNTDQFQTELDRLKVTPITPSHAHYPPLLSQLEDAPTVLYVKGHTSTLSSDFMAIVGTRGMTEYGRRVTSEITTALTPYFGIISGLARGIDTVAHTTTIAQSGVTVAVMGTGIDQIYPKENERLSQQIMEKGALVSEYPPHTDGLAFRFPQRNRIISGMARGTIVVEAKAKSGALSTAAHAISQNRDLFAVPGPIFSENAVGPNQLIKQGAICITHPSDIIEEYHRLPLPKKVIATTPTASEVSLPDMTGLTPTEQAIWEALATPSQTIDSLSETTQTPLYQLLPTLTIFELKGWITVGPGKRYSRR